MKTAAVFLVYAEFDDDAAANAYIQDLGKVESPPGALFAADPHRLHDHTTSGEGVDMVSRAMHRALDDRKEAA